MRKIIFHYSVGYAGMDGVDAVAYPDDVTEDQLNEDAWLGALQHAESYGYYNRADYDEADIPTEEEEEEQGWNADQYVDSIEGWWEDYNPEEHDGLVPGGGEWKWD